MKLYLVRHGIAQDRDAEGVTSDADRALTRKGESRTRKAARGLRAMGVQPDVIATSPYRRARETADILADELQVREEPAVCDFLAPGATVGALVDWLLTTAGDSCMVVGHVPDVGRLAAGVLRAAGGIDITFGKAAVCCVSFDEAPAEGQGTLEWLLQPRHLRALSEVRP
jgi:phosphohistidine phosphatase